MEPAVVLEARGDGRSVLFFRGVPTAWDVLRPIANVCRRHRTLLAALPGYGTAPSWSFPTTAIAGAEAIERAVLEIGVS